MPVLEFYVDGTLDEVFKMDALFDKLKAEREEREIGNENETETKNEAEETKS